MNRFAAMVAPLLLAAATVPANAAGNAGAPGSQAQARPAPAVMAAPAHRSGLPPVFKGAQKRERAPIDIYGPRNQAAQQGSGRFQFCRATLQPGSFTGAYTVAYVTTSRIGCLIVPWGLAGIPWTVVPAASGPPSPDGP